MSFYEFTMLLYDTYLMDMCFPKFRLPNKSMFEYFSYRESAIYALEEFVRKHIETDSEIISMNQYIKYVRLFKAKMKRYSLKNKKGFKMFDTAVEAMEDVEDLLIAMLP